MESLETILLLLGCVMVSSVFDQVLSRVSIPLVQIGLGAVVGILVADEATVIFSDPEFFMLIFIAPLLFDEARHADKQALWENKGAVLSLAIGLVLLTMLVVGFVLHLVVPSIPLAAAFALGAALGPTDAVAVAALGKEVSLTKRQNAHLKGEALINDASGVVSFEFAIAAAVTGAFSVVEAAEAFVVEFFGGIALGLALAAVIMFVLRRVLAVGLESPTVYVLLEVCTPFFAYLLSEQVGVSGVLAVVAAGLFMKFYPSSLTLESSRYAVASENVWELVVYVVNGVVFVLLGMKLPEIIMPTWNESGASGAGVWLLGLIVLITLVVEGVRLAWCLGMELASAKSLRITKEKVCSALVTTLSGPKGAVTLSIVLSIPYYVSSGLSFPNRDLLIFLASGVIICTLLLASFVVPLLAPGTETSESAKARSDAEVEILQNVILELEAQKTPENEAATIAAIESYRNRIEIAREDDDVNDLVHELRLATLRDQLDYVREKVKVGAVDRSAGELYSGTLSRRLASMERGRKPRGVPTGQMRTPFSWGVRALAYRAVGRSMSDKEKRELNVLIRDAEQHAVAYLDAVAAASDDEGKRIVALLKTEYTASYSIVDEVAAKAGAVPVHVAAEPGAQSDAAVTRKFKLNVGDALDTRKAAKKKSRAVEAKALGIELEQIQQMREAGRITPADARELRNEVYVLQMGLEAR